MNQYLQLVSRTLSEGEMVDTRNGRRLTVYGEMLRFDLRKGFPILTTKKVPFRWVAGELCWFLDGDQNTRKLKDWGISIWDANADELGYVGPIYGYQWRSWNGPHGRDQIMDCVQTIERTKHSTRNVVLAWNPDQNFCMALPPCHFSFQVHHSASWVRVHATMRSTDLMVGLPFNISSYALLAHILAKRTNRIAVELVMSLSDIHIYEDHIETAKLQVTRSAMPLPKLMIRENEITHDLKGMQPNGFILDNYLSHEALSYPMHP